MGLYILNFIRGYLTRKCFLSKKKAVIKIQNFSRVVKAKKDLLARFVQHQRYLAKLDRYAEKSVDIVMKVIEEELLATGVETIMHEEMERLVGMYNSHARYRTLYVRMSLGIPLLKELASVGPAKVVKWGLYSKLLSFDDQKGYRIGSMLSQVLKAVEDDDKKDCKHGVKRDGVSTAKGESNEDESEERIIKIAKKEEHEDIDNCGVTIPREGRFPVRWGQQVTHLGRCKHVTSPSKPVETSTTSPSNESKHNGLMDRLHKYDENTCYGLIDGDVHMNTDTDILSSELDLMIDIAASKIEVYLNRSQTTEFKRSEDKRFEKFISSNMFREYDGNSQSENDSLDVTNRGLNDVDKVVVYLQPVEDPDGNLNLIMKARNDDTIPDHDCGEAVDIDDYRFHLRNVVVIVTSKPETATLEPMNDINMSDENDAAEQEELVDVVRLVVEEPEPDYDLMAMRITRMLRKNYVHRNTTVKILQSFLKTYFIMKHWKQAVHEVYKRAVAGCKCIQRTIRGMFARKHVNTVVRVKVLTELDSKFDASCEQHMSTFFVSQSKSVSSILARSSVSSSNETTGNNSAPNMRFALETVMDESNRIHQEDNVIHDSYKAVIANRTTKKKYTTHFNSGKISRETYWGVNMLEMLAALPCPPHVVDVNVNSALKQQSVECSSQKKKSKGNFPAMPSDISLEIEGSDVCLFEEIDDDVKLNDMITLYGNFAVSNTSQDEKGRGEVIDISTQCKHIVLPPLLRRIHERALPVDSAT